MLFHPLCGANPATLWQVMRRNGGVPMRYWPHVGIAGASAVSRWPFTLTERVMVRRRFARRGAMPPPIFILGHWRSGTTHLYNVMSRAERFGYIPPVATGLPWDMLLLARLLRPLLHRLLPEQRFIDPIPVRPDSPQEDEAALANMQPLSFYHGLYFPRRLRENFDAGVFLDGCSPHEVARWQRRMRYFLRKVALAQGNKPLLVKNPVYTARVRMLREMFPGARFIHLHRHPLAVFRSMRNFYHRLLEAMALQPYDASSIDDLILDAYPRMMRQLIDESVDLPAERFIEVGYDDLDDDPLGVLERIYRQLSLGDFAVDRPQIEAYLASVQQYQRNTYQLEPDAQQRVWTRWQPFFERWGYEGPRVTSEGASEPALASTSEP